MPDLENFLTVAATHPQASLTLSSDGAAVITRSGRGALWIMPLQAGENRLVASRFIEALKKYFGADLSSEVAASAGLARNRSFGEPLTGRKVLHAFSTAQNLRMRNLLISWQLAKHLSTAEIPQGPTTDSVAHAVQQAAARHYPGNTSVPPLVDLTRVSRKVCDEILTAAMEDRGRLVSGAAARAIQQHVVEQELIAAQNSARRGALQGTNPPIWHAMLHRSIASAFARFDPPLALAGAGLSPDATEALHEPLRTWVESGAIPVAELNDATVLQSATATVSQSATVLQNATMLRKRVEQAAADFIAERNAARAAVAQLRDIDDAAKAALLAQVTQDSIPPSLVSQLGYSYPFIHADLADLAQPLPTNQLENRLSLIHDLIASGIRHAGLAGSKQNRELAYRFAWRFLLAPGGAAQAQAIHLAMATENSRLRCIAEAATWYATQYSDKAEQDRPGGGIDRLRAGRKPRARESLDIANKYSQSLICLQAVLKEKAPATGWIRQFTPNQHPSEQTVATLRNLGIDFPSKVTPPA